MRNMRWTWLAAGGLLLLGCLLVVLWLRGGSEPRVTGTVLLDGQPLDNGKIELIPLKGTPGPGGGGGINEKGEYEIKRGLRPGKYRVEIRSTRTLPRKVPNPFVPYELVDEEAPVIPEEYNTNSSLIREVGPGSNVLDFDLKGVAARR
jgi:hypothetical protein